MLDAVKNYLSLASGVTEVTRQRATAAAKALAASGEATAEQVSNLADDLVVNSRNNRDAMLALVRYELDRALSRLGLATADEVTSLQRRVTVLEGALALAAKAGDATSSATEAPRKASKATPARKSASSSSATKAAPSKSAPSKAAPSKAAPSKAPARKTAATATAARKTAAKASPAKKAASGGSS